jgi:hypothetical protein
MKKCFIIVAVMWLTGCAGMGMSGQSGSGNSGSGIDTSPAFNRTFDPNDPYHGG